MKQVLLILLFVFFVASFASIDDDQAWSAWKAQYGFEENLRSEMKAYKNFKENEEKVKNHNANAGRSFDLGLNEFSAMDEETFAETYFGTEPELDEIQRDQARSFLSPRELENIPKIVDNRNIQTPVQHQQKCGNCWAFATTAGIGLKFFTQKFFF